MSVKQTPPPKLSMFSLVCPSVLHWLAPLNYYFIRAIKPMNGIFRIRFFSWLIGTPLLSKILLRESAPWIYEGSAILDPGYASCCQKFNPLGLRLRQGSDQI